MKKIIQIIINFFGYKITKLKSPDLLKFNILTEILIKKRDPIIFDVGANKGQSIVFFKKLFQNPIIHSFEPNSDELNILKKNYNNDRKVHLNNVAVGNKKGNLKFNINAISGHSSFKKLVPNTTWIKKRSNEFNISDKHYTIKKINTEVITLDDYANDKNILHIDILKIDTQGFENKVLQGAKNLLKKNRIKIIKVELIFSEIYEDPLQIYDVEKELIPNNYKLFGISNSGSLISTYNFQSDFIYMSDETYKNFKLNFHI